MAVFVWRSSGVNLRVGPEKGACPMITATFYNPNNALKFPIVPVNVFEAHR